MAKKIVTTPAPKVQAFMLPDAKEHYGSAAAQAEMDSFLNSLNLEQRSAIASMQKVMQSGACYDCGYRKVLRYVFAWFQNHGQPITVQL
jgi:hypothetical protein